ncbi:uncharacterized protein BO66DRAFT_389472 [Aspergillus aculeatinus CBS 121060]|uniref:Uncharacterized protein n=1 Tax=Aspergillus aculeatinus CBS 121060 TaxID=1448322 RepID=A0ACD1HHQ9_9EURO|nr:hypothetical protein BO66DRAFT_389472 [Aspergillus aculeatinus CBS 121060]RAH72898.1 hypothetical protein BO66DRAFT_389472 [Aspergillus aculeatinus CBS 121060]
MKRAFKQRPFQEVGIGLAYLACDIDSDLKFPCQIRGGEYRRCTTLETCSTLMFCSSRFAFFRSVNCGLGLTPRLQCPPYSRGDPGSRTTVHARLPDAEHSYQHTYSGTNAKLIAELIMVRGRRSRHVPREQDRKWVPSSESSIEGTERKGEIVHDDMAFPSPGE